MRLVRVMLVILLGAGVFALVAIGHLALALRHTAQELSETALASRLVLAEIREQIPETAASLNTKADRTLRGIDSLIDATHAEIHPIGSNLSKLSDSIDHNLSELSAVRGDLAPLLDEAAGTAAAARLTIRDLRPQLLGLVAASKISAGEVASAMRDVQHATPQAILTFDRIGANIDRTTIASAKASEATALTMQNLAKATKPLTPWVRIPLTITGAIAPTVAGALTGAAATGAFR